MAALHRELRAVVVAEADAQHGAAGIEHREGPCVLVERPADPESVEAGDGDAQAGGELRQPSRVDRRAVSPCQLHQFRSGPRWCLLMHGWRGRQGASRRLVQPPRPTGPLRGRACGGGYAGGAVVGDQTPIRAPGTPGKPVPAHPDPPCLEATGHDATDSFPTRPVRSRRGRTSGKGWPG